MQLLTYATIWFCGVFTSFYPKWPLVTRLLGLGLDPNSDDFEEDAALLAEAMITISAETKDPHWDESARALLTAIIIYVVLIAKKRGTVPAMARVRELLCMANEAPLPKSHAAPYGTEGKGIPKLAHVMMRSSRASLSNLAAQFTAWNREKEGIASSAMRQTKSFDAPQISRNMARNDFDFNDLKREPTTVYIVIPPHMLERHGKWLRLVITSALRASMRPREAGEPSILYILDEMAAYGHLKIVETVFSQVRGYGIQMLPVFQDMLQLKDIYKDRWESFIANAGALLFFRPNDMTTADWLSKRLGETTQMIWTMNESKSENDGASSGSSNSPSGAGSSTGSSRGTSFSESTNFSPVKVPLTLPHELFGLKDGEMRVFLTGIKDGLTLYAPFYSEIKSRDLRARPNPYFHKVPRRQASPKLWSDFLDPNDDGRWDSGMPSIPEYDATVKSFDVKKGYGVVTLADGIAVLHANILHKTGFTDLRPGTTLRVHIQQADNGRMVSQVLSVVDEGDWDKAPGTDGWDSGWNDCSNVKDGWAADGDDTF